MACFSIVTVNYNDAAGLEKTIQSVILQNCRDFEFIVIDGGSSDGSKTLIESHTKDFSFWCSEPDNGIYNAMNKGIRHATGRYLIFMNSGDCFHSKDVLLNVKPLLDGTDIIAGYALTDNNKYLNLHEDNVLMMFLHSTFSHQATFIKRDLFDNYRYDEKLNIISDWEAWLDWVIFGGKSYKYINTIVSDYDMSGVSSNSDNWQKVVDERNKVLSSHFPPIVLENLMEYHDMYIKAHLKYIKKYPKLEELAYFVLKSIAFVGKSINSLSNK